jgi:hypothetical protein
MEYKNLPSGISDFKLLRESNFYFVDKTPYIKKIERAGNFLFLLRPRRFGKTLFLSMLQTYYDIKERDNFDRYFAGTWIADNPTEDRGKYQMLMLDFSRIDNSTNNLNTEFNDYCCIMINRFIDKYKDSYSESFRDEILSSTKAVNKLNNLAQYAKDAGIPLFLIVDEYDNFTNTVLAKEGHEMYHAITHASGFYRTIFKIFKGSFARIVMTGVSPVTLDDLTSGYNIATNITLEPFCNSILGFSKEEVLTMMHYYQQAGVLHAEEEERMINEMADWYDGYCFSAEAAETGVEIFNSSMVIRYIQYNINNGTLINLNFPIKCTYNS